MGKASVDFGLPILHRMTVVLTPAIIEEDTMLKNVSKIVENHPSCCKYLGHLKYLKVFRVSGEMFWYVNPS